MKNILVVDDSPFFIESLRDLLTKEGFNVETALSGEEALEILNRSDKPANFDLLITDLVMPGISGYELAQYVREKNKVGRFTPVIMLTEKEITKQEARKHGCSAYIPKSNFEKTRSMVKALLKQD
ncbi:MAG: response regulator [Desulfuromonadales bacterium]|nr:response regulator [Desulfuromonadales bacterium]